MGFVQIAVGVLLILFSIGGYSAQLEYYSVVNIKNKKVLNLRAWPSTKSKVIAHLTPQTKNIIFLSKRKVVAKDEWMKVRWNKQEGWVNGYFLQKQTQKSSEFDKTIIEPKVIQKMQQQDLIDTKQHTPVASVENKPVLNSRNQTEKNTLDQDIDNKPVANEFEQQGDRYIQPEDISSYNHIKTRLGHAFAVQPRVKSRLSCRGSKPAKWKINMNMSSKRMWLKIEDKGSYSLPITYSQWNRTSRKRMIVLAGKGRKRVKAMLNRNRLCRRKFSRARYTYSINATVSQSQLLSGCCADISR